MSVAEFFTYLLYLFYYLLSIFPDFNYSQDANDTYIKIAYERAVPHILPVNRYVELRMVRHRSLMDSSFSMTCATPSSAFDGAR